MAKANVEVTKETVMKPVEVETKKIVLELTEEEAGALHELTGSVNSFDDHLAVHNVWTALNALDEELPKFKIQVLDDVYGEPRDFVSLTVTKQS